MSLSKPIGRVLITAGPTREHIDDVRFLSNLSTGRMGLELARAALAQLPQAGVTVVLGPTSLTPPVDERLTVVPVVSAQQMHDAVMARAAQADLFIAAAAVADYRPAARHAGKLKKQPGPLTLQLERTPDILAAVGANRRTDQILIGFALEVQSAEANARDKLARKNCDAIVLNSPANFGDAAEQLTLIRRDGSTVQIAETTKSAAASALLRTILAGRV
jgi:phosphopantothenoylcysteine decarboxylase/phosphopantothenate--cysteine ligase